MLCYHSFPPEGERAFTKFGPLYCSGSHTVFSFGGLYYVNLLLTSQLFNIIYLYDIGMTLLILYDCHSCTQKSKWCLES